MGSGTHSRWKRWLMWASGALLVSIGALLAWSYSWTFTDQGRMEYGAALMVKLVSMQSQREPVLNATTRQRSNENTVKWLGQQTLRPVAGIEDLEVPGPAGPIPVRVYVPDAAGPLPIYLMIHGGGFWMGNDLRIEEPTARMIANEAGVIVVAVDYRLAPEHPFPAALEDCYAVLSWLASHGQELGGDPDRIAVGGGSAGGNLSAAVALKARDENGPAIAYQLLIVPSTDLSGDQLTGSIARSSQYILSAKSMQVMRDAYLPDPALRTSPYASPLLAPDHSRLPTTYIITAQFDPLREQGLALGDKLQAAGVETTVIDVPGVVHGFLGSSTTRDQVFLAAARAMGNSLHSTRH